MSTQYAFIQSTLCRDTGGYRRVTWGQLCFWGAPLYGVVYRGAREGSINGGRGACGDLPIRAALQRGVGVCRDPPPRRMESAVLGNRCGWGASERHRLHWGAADRWGEV